MVSVAFWHTPTQDGRGIARHGPQVLVPDQESEFKYPSISVYIFVFAESPNRVVLW